MLLKELRDNIWNFLHTIYFVLSCTLIILEISYQQCRVEARKDKGVKHALAVRADVTSRNYVSFFKLYKNAPNLKKCLMDLYVEKMRYAAVKCMTHSYSPTFQVSYVAMVLGFRFQSADSTDDKDTSGLEECTEWLKAHSACLATDSSVEAMLDAKASMASLFMPRAR